MEGLVGSRRPVLVNLGASKPENRWSNAAFAELVRALASNEDVVLTGGPEDRSLFADVLCELPAGVLDLVGRANLLELAALCRRARTMVACDTGPMHVAVASGLRVVALFGPADPVRTGPYGEGHRIVRPRDGSRRTLDVHVDDVLAALSSTTRAGRRSLR